MLEGILCGLIAFAAGYVLIMRMMARRADVLHGEFIKPEGRDVMGSARFPYWLALRALCGMSGSASGKV